MFKRGYANNRSFRFCERYFYSTATKSIPSPSTSVWGSCVIRLEFHSAPGKNHPCWPNLTTFFLSFNAKTIHHAWSSICLPTSSSVLADGAVRGLLFKGFGYSVNNLSLPKPLLRWISWKKSRSLSSHLFLSNIPENEHFPKVCSLVLIEAWISAKSTPKKLSVFQR